MSLISLLIILFIAGVVLWLINTYIPMDGKIKKIFNAGVVIIAIFWLLGAFGVLGSMSHMRIGR